MLLAEDKINHDNPTSLFKYYSISDRLIKDLKNNEFWFSSPRSFNDPFDCLCEMIWHVSRGALIDSKNLKLNPHHGLKIGQLLNHDDEAKLAQFVIEKFINSIDNSGVFCLSTTPYEILMWSHYTNSHKGICIEFERNPNNELGSDSCSPVVYGGYHLHNISMGLEHLQETIQYVFHRKSDHWRYEKEWRLVYMPRDPSESVYGHHKIQAKIKSITFGVLAEDRDIVKVRSCFDQSVKVYKMIAKTTEQRVVPEEIK